MPQMHSFMLEKNWHAVIAELQLKTVQMGYAEASQNSTVSTDLQRDMQILDKQL